MRFFCVIFLIVAGVGCKEKKAENLLPKERLQALVWDMMQADEMMSYYTSADTSYKAINHRKKLYARIYRAHHVTEDEFLNTIHYYEKHPSTEIKRLIDSLQAMGERTRKLTDTLKVKNYPESTNRHPLSDSIKNNK